VAQLADQEDGEHLGVREFVLAGTAAGTGGVGAPIAALHPSIDDAIDDQKQVLPPESAG
jgi:hypothetical protein